MKWHDYVAILITILIALFADLEARVAFRASVAALICDLSQTQDWIRNGELRRIFGSSIYPTLKKLEADGIIERRVEIADVGKLARRRGFPNAWYRWKTTPKPWEEG